MLKYSTKILYIRKKTCYKQNLSAFETTVTLYIKYCIMRQILGTRTSKLEINDRKSTFSNINLYILLLKSIKTNLFFTIFKKMYNCLGDMSSQTLFKNTKFVSLKPKLSY